MKNSDELTIKITADGKILVQETDGVTISYKEIDPDAFFDCIKGSLKHGAISSGILPQGCFHFAVDESGTRHVAMEFPSLSADITYQKTLYEQFPLPKLVFGFTVSKDGAVGNVRIGITENKKITLESKMYVFPFSNVSGFSVCIGVNRMPKVSYLSQLNGIPYYVLGMPFNEDHFASQSNRLGLESRALYEHLKDKDAAYYYSNVLIGSGLTIKDFIQN